MLEKLSSVSIIFDALLLFGEVVRNAVVFVTMLSVFAVPPTESVLFRTKLLMINHY